MKYFTFTELTEKFKLSAGELAEFLDQMTVMPLTSTEDGCIYALGPDDLFGLMFALIGYKAEKKIKAINGVKLVN